MFVAILRAYREAFSGLPRRVWLLSAVTLVHRSGTMVLPFLTIYLTTQRGLSVRASGLYLALYGIGGVLGALVGGKLAERLGNGRAMQITLAAAGLGFFLLGTARDPWAIALVLLATSIAAEGFRTPSSAELGVVAAPEVRARAFGLRRLAINLGMALGPAVGGLLATIDYGWLFAVDGATCLLAAAAVAAFLPARREAAASRQPGEPEPEGPAPSLWRDRVFLGVLGATVLMNLAFAQLFSTYPLTLKLGFGYSEAVIGAVMAVNTVLIVLFEMVLLHRLSGARPLFVAAAGCLTLAAGYALVPYDPRIAFALLAVCVITLGEMLTHPVIEAFVASHVPEAAMGKAMGMLTAAFSATFVVAPILGTAVFEAWGYQLLWLASAAVSALAAAGFAYFDARTRRRRGAPAARA